MLHAATSVCRWKRTNFGISSDFQPPNSPYNWRSPDLIKMLKIIFRTSSGLYIRSTLKMLPKDAKNHPKASTRLSRQSLDLFQNIEIRDTTKFRISSNLYIRDAFKRHHTPPWSLYTFLQTKPWPSSSSYRDTTNFRISFPYDATHHTLASTRFSRQALTYFIRLKKWTQPT